MKKQCLLACLLCLTLILFPGCSFLSDLLLPGSADPAATGEPTSLSSSAAAGPSEEEAPVPAPSGGAASTPAPAPEAVVSPEELLDRLYFHLDLINQCYAETYGAELGSTAYRLVYTSLEAAMAGEAPIAVVEESAADHSNITDPTDSTLYEILNFKTNAEALAYLQQYMTPDIAGELFHEFLEMDGKLYMVYGGRGYGAEQLDLDSASVSVSGDTCSVTLDFCLFDEKVNTCTVSFAKQGEDWIITAIDGDTL